MVKAWEMNLGNSREPECDISSVFICSALGQICMLISYWDMQVCLHYEREGEEETEPPSTRPINANVCSCFTLDNTMVHQQHYLVDKTEQWEETALCIPGLSN